MKRLKIKLLAIVALLSIHMLHAQESLNPSIVKYIETYAALAIKEMNRTGIPASIKLAQGILETKAGKSDLVMRSNNHFGLKCKSTWTGGKVYHDDDEAGECFRQYGSAEESYIDHSNYLKSQTRYSFLFNYSPEDYSAWAHGLKKAGYATNPIYAQTLIKYIETYKLDELQQYIADEEEMDLSAYLQALNTSSTPTVTAPVAQQKTNSYPAGIFKINGLKVVYAEKGTSILSLAKKYKSHVPSLITFNELSSSTTILDKDQLVFLERKKKTGKTPYHRVQKGETMKDISQLEGIRLNSLLQLNKLKPGMQPKVGQQLSLQQPKQKRPLLAKK